MSYISSFGNPEYRAIPALIDSITTDAITFSDGSVQVSAFNAVDLSNITVDTLTITDEIIFSDASTLTSVSGANNVGVYYDSTSTDAFTIIPSSATSITFFSKDSDIDPGADTGFVVLPGWAFQIFQDESYGALFSNIMTNSGTTKQLFFLEGSTKFAGGTVITKTVDSVTTPYTTLSLSLKVFYKGVEQLITGIS